MEPAGTVVCVQGLGFVGFAMATAVAHARDTAGNPYFQVIGVDLPTPEGRAKVEAINSGRLPFQCTDEELASAFEAACRRGNLRASTDPAVYEKADISVVDVHLDVLRNGSVPAVRFDGFRAAIRTLGERMRPGSLVIVETTVPPGTCQHVAALELAAALRGRGLPEDSIRLAHSYERVMPGRDYFRSIVNYWRVYAGMTEDAAAGCAAFLSKVIDVGRYPLTRLGSTTASETAKVLENSYRALNIAFIQEWGEFAEAVGIDLFDVIDAIRMRPTHSNMRQPGFGVGGYCLTKDPLLAGIAARQVFRMEGLRFCFSEMAVGVNDRMPLHTLDTVRRGLGGLSGKKLLLLGVSYRQDVGDTRYSPSEILVRAAEGEGATVACHDPLVSYWSEMGRSLPAAVPAARGVDAVIFAVAHADYRRLNLEDWLDGDRPFVVDANNVLTSVQRNILRRLNCRAASIGRGC